jgi:oligosaccharide repeat unit polymerase
LNNLPTSYFIAVLLFGMLLVFAVANRKAAWSVPFGAVVAMIGAWYLIEPFYFPELFETLDPEHVETAFNCVCIFFMSLLFLAPAIAKKMEPRASAAPLAAGSSSGDRVVAVVAILWLLLLAFGTFQMGGDLLGALFPLQGRAGNRLWARDAGAGAGLGGFIISTASYLYVLCLSSFGVLLFFVKKKSRRVLLIFLIAISWPYAFLQGSRNIALAAVLPAGLAFLLFSNASIFKKTIITFVGVLALDVSFRLIIAFRSVGFSNADFDDIAKTTHLGLNMASELTYISTFLKLGTVQLDYGVRYLSEIANVIPRAIWPNKPLLGIDYAIARGFADPTRDIGVFATISSGAIGQAALSFGTIFGPMFAAVLFGVWVGILSRFRLQKTPLRSALFLVGLGLTFNLGRDVTLLVLWPMVFGYLGIRLYESRERHRDWRLVRRGAAKPVIPSVPRRSASRRQREI